MNAVSYVLKSQSGCAILAFDNEARALEVMAERQRRGVNLRLFEQQVVERELTPGRPQ